MNKEVTTGEEAKNKLVEGINKLSEAVLTTMGPMGRTVIIFDEYGNPRITKDGVSVANAVRFKDTIENTAAKLIKEVAQKTADEAGDGTTTSICLAQSFINHGLELLANEVTIVDLQQEIDSLVEDTISALKKSSKKLKLKNISKVATISANNDKAIGNIIQKAYNKSDIVKVEEGTSISDEVEVVNGMKFPVSYMSNNFINNQKKKEVFFEDPNILVLNKKLEDLKPYAELFDYLARNNKPLVIFTEFVADSTLKVLESLVINKQFNVAVIKAPGFGEYRKDNLADIAAFTGATVITNDTLSSIDGTYLGHAKKINATKLNTVISKADDIDIKQRITELKEQSKKAELDDYDRGHIIDRINNLCGSLSIIRVGGSSEVEMKERKDRVEDAVLAVKSALEEGIVEGGGMALLRTYVDLIDKKDCSDIRKSLAMVLTAPSATLYLNSDGKIEAKLKDNNFNKDIIDPLKVTRCALENAASVAKTILSTDAIVLPEELWR